MLHPVPDLYGETKLIVLTGGPGAGKTAVLEIIRRQLCPHVAIIPEAASVIFGGGFWRLPSVSARCAAQRAIMHVQQEMEVLVAGEKQWPVALCDRGVLDGLAYWPAEEEFFWRAAQTTLVQEYARYHTVIHLRVPDAETGYDHSNPLRTETPDQAQHIDRKIAAIWQDHPRYHTIGSTPDFLEKAQRAIALIAAELPEACVQMGLRH